MMRISLGLAAILAALLGNSAFAADQGAPSASGAAPGAPPSTQQGQAQAPAGAPQNQGQAPAAASSGGNSQDVARSAAKGTLKSPYQDAAKVADEGHQKFMSAGCNGCHGGGGGGGMGPPLTNAIWIYGNDDDVLFRLIVLGSDELQKQGFSRKGSENVVGPMPAMGTVLKSPDDVWKVIAWIKTANQQASQSSSTNSRPAQ